MPTASIVRRPPIAARRRRPARPRALAWLVLAVAAAAVTGGCARKPAILHEDLLEPLAVRQPWLPSEADLAAARLARAALVAEPRAGEADPAVETALAGLETVLDSGGGSEALDDLLPLAIDLRNATLDDPIADRAASRALDRRHALDPRLQARVDRTVRDDPLRLAGRREFDGWHRLWARTFNAVVEPLGSSVITGFVLAPYNLANSLIHYFAEFSNSEPLSLTDRQALDLREEFVARHPDSPIVPEVRARIERDRVKRNETLARRRLRATENALEVEGFALARHHGEQARALVDRDPEAHRRTRRRIDAALESAHEALERRHALEARSLTARPTPAPLARAERDLAARLLVEPIRPETLVQPLADYRAAATAAPTAAPAPTVDAPSTPTERLETYVDARIDFVRALAQREDGHEAASRRRLRRAATGRPERDAMVRHARALIDDPWQNPHGAFERLRRQAGRDELAWRLAGEWVRRPRYPNLPTPVAYVIDAPTIAMTVALSPLRAILSPWTGDTPDFQRGAALAGYRYLVRYPGGEEQRPVVDWLFAYESRRERWGRALRLADAIPDFDPDARAELVEKTAEQRVDSISRVDRRDSRYSILSGVAQEFPDSAGGHAAGLRARAEQADASAQSIRISRDFLRENPEVAGREGLGLNPALLNDELVDGELHPDGVLLRGGRTLEIRLVDDGAKDDDPPASRFLELSPDRLRQLAAALDEAVQRNGLVDADARQDPDAGRDVYLERAGLGLADDVDPRPTAASSFEYLSLRERYGMVRGRDSVLPFDLVFRGSLGDFTLGAFPRWRPPKETPDAFLYR